MRQVVKLLCLFILSFSLFAKDKLLFVVDVVRHGDRTPILLIENVPYRWKEELGELTEKGKQQHLALGEKLRKRYIEEEKLLPREYTNGSIYIRSTGYSRAIMSAESLLTGLYPSQTIPIHSQPKEKDILLSNEVYAEQFGALLKKLVYPSIYWQDMETKAKPTWAAWEKLAGFKIENLRHLKNVGNAVYIYQLYHVPFPPEFSKNEINELIDLHWTVMAKMYHPKEIGQLLGREQLNLIAEYMTKANQQNNALKYVLLSAHDSTLLSLMSALGAPLDKSPPYAAHLSFALYENASKQPVIVVRYNDQVVSIPGCHQDGCTLNELQKIG